MDHFNEAVRTLNEFVSLTLKNRGQTFSNHTKILKLGKKLNLPIEFFRKQPTELMQFLLSKDFIQMMRIHMHSLLNNLVFEQFCPRETSENDLQMPKLLSNLMYQFTSPLQEHSPNLYKFYTNAGNNHVVVRQVLKRRQWLQRLESIKKASHGQFEATSFFWT